MKKLEAKEIAKFFTERLFETEKMIPLGIGDILSTFAVIRKYGAREGLEYIVEISDENTIHCITPYSHCDFSLISFERIEKIMEAYKKSKEVTE